MPMDVDEDAGVMGGDRIGEPVHSHRQTLIESSPAPRSLAMNLTRRTWTTHTHTRTHRCRTKKALTLAMSPNRSSNDPGRDAAYCIPHQGSTHGHPPMAQALLLLGFAPDEVRTVEGMMVDLGAAFVEVKVATAAMMEGTLGQALEAEAQDEPARVTGYTEDVGRIVFLAGLSSGEVVQTMDEFATLGMSPGVSVYLSPARGGGCLLRMSLAPVCTQPMLSVHLACVCRLCHGLPRRTWNGTHAPC